MAPWQRAQYEYAVRDGRNDPRDRPAAGAQAINMLFEKHRLNRIA
jgi:hypothetical protein